MENDRLINTERLQIVPFHDRYLTSRYVSWLNDPEVVAFSEQRHNQHTLSTCQQYVESFHNSPHYLWAIVLKDEVGEHIGNINAYVDVHNKVADVGILIGEKSYWGHGYGLEAWKAVCQYLLRVAGMRKITAGTMSINTGMLNIMTRSGMIEEGRGARQFFCDGKEVDIVRCALFKNG